MALRDQLITKNGLIVFKAINPAIHYNSTLNNSHMSPLDNPELANTDAAGRPLTYVLRVRFKMSTRLNIKDASHHFQVGGRDVHLSTLSHEVSIADSDWLIMLSTGFSSEKDARTFAIRLKKAVEMASIVNRLGVDSGTDVAPSGFSAYMREEYKRSGLLVRNDVHGIDVYPYFENTKFVSASASLTVLKGAQPILIDVGKFFELIGNESQETKNIVLLLNYALMREDPVSQIVFAISAVEMLGQNEDWSENQKNMLEQLAAHAESMNDVCTTEERDEISTAIRNSLHKIGLRQGVVRLLKSLQLEHLKKEWDIVYQLRSKLVHGLAPQPGENYFVLAQRALNLCGSILLAVVERDIPGAASKVQGHYSIPERKK